MKARLMVMALIIGAMPMANAAYSLEALVAQVPAPSQEVLATVEAMKDGLLLFTDSTGRVCLTMPTEVCDGCGGG